MAEMSEKRMLMITVDVEMKMEITDLKDPSKKHANTAFPIHLVVDQDRLLDPRRWDLLGQQIRVKVQEGLQNWGIY